MSTLITSCAHCAALFRIPVSALLVTRGSDGQEAHVGYICTNCERFVDEPLPAGMADTLASAGLEFIDVTGVGR
jgi:hypothetical protein